jgi:uncharacterized protein YwbE
MRSEFYGKLGQGLWEDLLTQAASSDAAIKQRVNAVKT